MGLFSFFKRGQKKKSEQELEAEYAQKLNALPQEHVEKSEQEKAATQSESIAGVEEPDQRAGVQESEQSQPVEEQGSAEPQKSEPEPEAVRPSSSSEHTQKKKPKGVFAALKQAVTKTRLSFNRRVLGVLGLGQKIDEDILETLEEALVEADMGINTSEILIEDIREAWKKGELLTTDDILPFLKADLKHRLQAEKNTLNFAKEGPSVILVVGVNGSGKTTSIAKLANILTREGKKVLLIAADTFRAAAVEQLKTWSGRIGCEIYTAPQGRDPAAVVYEGCEQALQGNFDVVLVDTAGRLHTQKNLMEELVKVHRVMKKLIPDAPHETIMVLDATTGQNALHQAQVFKECVEVSGIFLAKLDGTAKGGAVLTINRHVDIPVKYVGLGESFDDVQRFNVHAFVDALFDESELVHAS